MVRPRTLLVLAAWCVPAALGTLQTYWMDGSHGCGGSLSCSAMREGIPWLVWAAATPVLLAAGARGKPLRRIARHVVAVIAIAVAFGSANGFIGHIVRATPSPRTLGGDVEMSIVDWSPIQPVLYAAVLIAGYAIESTRRRRVDELARARLETELATARLDALRAQIQPHFLFNTLNAAVTLARGGDADGCVRVLVLLGELLHELLRDEAPQEVALREELRLIELYLEIQRIRFGDRLRVRWNIDDAVRDALVPQLVLQPLVENAFRHGISRKTLAGKLDITAIRVGDDLELVVRDDGPGVEQPVRFGVGLRNTGERLKRLYGDRGTIRLTGEVDGAVAAVTLPLHMEASCAS